MRSDPIDRGISLPGCGGITARIFLYIRLGLMRGLPGHEDRVTHCESLGRSFAGCTASSISTVRAQSGKRTKDAFRTSTNV
jgi:hypothetical protein